MQHERWTEDKVNGSIYQFKQGNHWKGFQESLKLSSGFGGS